MTARKKSTEIDFAKVDAYVNTPADYEDSPELDDAFFERAVRHKGGAPVMGRPPLGNRTRQQVTLRLDADALDAFRATGLGWQGRMNEAFVEAAKHLKP